MAERVQTYKVFFDKEKLEKDSVRLARTIYNSGYSPDTILGIWRGGTFVATYVTGGLKRLGVRHHHFSATGKSYNPGISNQSSVITIYNMEELMKYMRQIRAERVCGVDDVLDSFITADAFINIIQNGLVRKSAFIAHQQDGETITDIDVADAMKMDSDAFVLYDFEMPVNGGQYTLRIPLVNDVRPLDAEVKFAAPYWKPHANKTNREPDFVLETVNIKNGKWPWINFPYELEADDITDDEMWEHRPALAKILLENAGEQIFAARS